MSVLVCFHAHPDDEVFSTGGSIRMAADAGHRVVLVTATDGAVGEHPEGLLDEGETLVERRQAELAESANALGVHRVVMLGYSDSGMAGTADNDDPAAFTNIDTDAAASVLAEILREEQADVLTFYDDNGNYGHPDHIKVHYVGKRAAEMVGVTKCFECVANRDQMRLLFQAQPEWGDGLDVESIGVPDNEIDVAVDVASTIEVKRAAMRAHASQVGDFGPFLEMPVENLLAAFGTEWFRSAGGSTGIRVQQLPL